MFGSVMLEVAIGLAFIYVLLSLLCSSLNEMIAGFSICARSGKGPPGSPGREGNAQKPPLAE